MPSQANELFKLLDSLLQETTDTQAHLAIQPLIQELLTANITDSKYNLNDLL